MQQGLITRKPEVWCNEQLIQQFLAELSEHDVTMGFLEV